MKRVFNLLLLVSFVFVFIYLIRQDFIIPDIQKPGLLAGSLALLFAGFYSSTWSWKVALRSHQVDCTSRLALKSHGLSVFAKYIPGKVWVILGRAGYLSDSKKDLKNLAFISFKEQLIYLWAGFVISSIPTVLFYGVRWISGLVLLVIIGLTLFLFVEKIHAWSMGILQKILRRELEVPLVSLSGSWRMIGAVLVIWIFWTVGFYLFMLAFSDQVTPVMMFAFPLSVCFGLLAIILPGGLGLREGIIIGYLIMAGLETEAATTISFLNRLWFIAGEVFIFLLALLAKRR